MKITLTKDEARTIKQYLNVDEDEELSSSLISYVVYSHGAQYAQGFVDFFFGHGDVVETK